MNHSGGSNPSSKVLDLTRGHFDSNFDGCVKNIVIMGNKVKPTSGSADMSGLNVDSCSSSSASNSISLDDEK